MPSTSLQSWKSSRRIALGEIVGARRSLGGTAPGRRYATQQINHAYAVHLSAQFQGFCRDLHSESVDFLVLGVSPNALRATFRNSLVRNRKLNWGNPNPGNIGSDYDALGLDFWAEVKRLSVGNQARLSQLQELNDWRNAIAHQDFTKLAAGPILRFQHVKRWRSACNQLAVAFDEVMRQHIGSTTGVIPW